MTDETAFREEIQDNKNKNNIRCQFCNCLILKKQLGSFVEAEEFNLPTIHQKHSRDVNEVDTELLHHFWLINDMYTFENIGFSNTVKNMKFLTCAECDMGPVGYHDTNNKQCYIALKRVRHGDPPPSLAFEE